MLGLIAVILALIPWPAHADDEWMDGRRFGLQESANGKRCFHPWLASRSSRR